MSPATVESPSVVPAARVEPVPSGVTPNPPSAGASPDPRPVALTPARLTELAARIRLR